MTFYIEIKGGSFFNVVACRYHINTEYIDSICFTDSDDNIVCEIQSRLVNSISVFIHTSTYNQDPKEVYLYKVMDDGSIYNLSGRFK